MQELLYIKNIVGEYELYCRMCHTVFAEWFVKNDVPAFCDIHRDIHRRMSLDTPDLPDNLPDYPQNIIELCTGLSTDLD